MTQDKIVPPLRFQDGVDGRQLVVRFDGERAIPLAYRTTDDEAELPDTIEPPLETLHRVHTDGDLVLSTRQLRDLGFALLRYTENWDR